MVEITTKMYDTNDCTGKKTITTIEYSQDGMRSTSTDIDGVTSAYVASTQCSAPFDTAACTCADYEKASTRMTSMLLVTLTLMFSTC